MLNQIELNIRNLENLVTSESVPSKMADNMIAD